MSVQFISARVFRSLVAVLFLSTVGCSPTAEEAAAPGETAANAPPIESTVEPTADPTVITPVALAERIEAGDGPLVLDVRSPDEFAGGHIPGAVNIPHDQLSDRIAELPVGPEGEVIVHCQRGHRASEAEEILRAAGFSKVIDLEGHFESWQESELPEEK
jgi:rhodanese-related sulfurtransferase